MQTYPSDIAFTPAVKGIQTAKGSRTSYAKAERREPARQQRRDGVDIGVLDLTAAQSRRRRSHSH